MKLNITDSQNLVLQAFLSILGAALVGTGQAVFQYLFTANNGTIDYRAALAFAAMTFGVLFWRAAKRYVPAHVAQELQAAKDTGTQLPALQRAIDMLIALMTQSPKSEATLQPVQNAAPPATITIHVNGQPLVTAGNEENKAVQSLSQSTTHQSAPQANVSPAPSEPGDILASPPQVQMPAHVDALSFSASVPQIPFPTQVAPAWDPATSDTLTQVAISAPQRKA